MISRRRKEDIFFPFIPIKQKNDRFFASRLGVLNDALESLSDPGSCLIIYGDRKVGKTSFAHQLINVVLGESSLEGAIKHEFVKKPLCIWAECTDDLKDVEGLVAELITSNDKYSLSKLCSKAYERLDVKEIVEKTREWNLNPVRIPYKNVKKSRFSNEITEIESKSIIFSYFRRLMSEIQNEYGNHEIIIFIDEFDRLDNFKGMGGLIKRFGNVHFVLVGIADSYNQLITDHLSVQDRLRGNLYKLKLWKDNEIAEIFTIAKKQYKDIINFESSFTNRVIDDCGGLPAYAHIIGNNALKIYVKGEYEKFDEQMYELAVKRFFKLDSYDFFTDELDEAHMIFISEIIKDKPILKEIINQLSKYPSKGVSESELYDQLNEQTKSQFNTSLEELSEKLLLKRYTTNIKKVRFVDPLMRVATIVANKYKIDL